MNEGSKKMFEKIRLFLTVYMPKQRGMSACTVGSYKQGINQFLTFICSKKQIQYDEISFQHWNAANIFEYIVYLENERNVAASTRNQRLFALRSFLKFASISTPELVFLSMDVSGIKPAKEAKEPVPFLSEIAMETLLRQPDDTTKIGLRDMCFMITMYDTAARDCEMLNLRLNSLDLNEKTPKVRLEGKGNKVRQVPLMKRTANHLRRYINVYHSSGASDDDWLTIQSPMEKRIRCQMTMLQDFCGNTQKWHGRNVQRFQKKSILINFGTRGLCTYTGMVCRFRFLLSLWGMHQPFQRRYMHTPTLK